MEVYHRDTKSHNMVKECPLVVLYKSDDNYESQVKYYTDYDLSEPTRFDIVIAHVVEHHEVFLVDKDNKGYFTINDLSYRNCSKTFKDFFMGNFAQQICDGYFLDYHDYLKHIPTQRKGFMKNIFKIGGGGNY